MKARCRIAALLIGIASFIVGCGGGTKELAPGQVWSYDARRGEGASTVQILHIEKGTALGDVAFVSIRALNASAGGGRIHAGTLWPVIFPVEALRKSLGSYQYTEAVKLDYQRALDTWRRAAAEGKARESMFTGTIVEALGAIETDTPEVRQRRLLR